MPPNLCSLSTSRRRCCWPVPHVRVQSPQPPHGRMAQSSWQGALLHGLDSDLYLHRLPLPGARRIRFWCPCPHEFVHLLHELNLHGPNAGAGVGHVKGTGIRVPLTAGPNCASCARKSKPYFFAVASTCSPILSPQSPSLLHMRRTSARSSPAVSL